MFICSISVPLRAIQYRESTVLQSKPPSRTCHSWVSTRASPRAGPWNRLCSAEAAIGCCGRLLPPLLPTYPRRAVVLCGAGGEPQCTRTRTGRGGDPSGALIHYRYGNYRGVFSEPRPRPVLPEPGPPGDTDYKTPQLRLTPHQSLAQILYSGRLRRRRMTMRNI